MLAGSELILHGGDVGDEEILARLEAIAPVRVVRGNVDRQPWTERLPATEVVEIGGLHIYMIHNLDHLDLDPAAAGMAAVVYGHTHMPLVREANGVVYFNPGSAGPRRFTLPISVGRMTISGGVVRVEVIDLPGVI